MCHYICSFYTIRYVHSRISKKRLPHTHILLWLDGENKLKTPTNIDKVISVQLPNQYLYPKLHRVVSNYMIHELCGPVQFNYPCMKEGRCLKYYPKNFTSCSNIDEEGYSSYKRRDDDSFAKKMEFSLIIPVWFLTIHLF